jgi:hypothetical protein
MNYFLVIFIDFFIFLIQIQILGPVDSCYRWVPVTAVYRADTTGKKTWAQPHSTERAPGGRCACARETSTSR